MSAPAGTAPPVQPPPATPPPKAPAPKTPPSQPPAAPPPPPPSTTADAGSPTPGDHTMIIRFIGGVLVGVGIYLLYKYMFAHGITKSADDDEQLKIPIESQPDEDDLNCDPEVKKKEELCEEDVRRACLDARLRFWQHWIPLNDKDN